MADRQDFEGMQPKLDALKAKDVRIPDMPVDQVLQEAEIMEAAAAEDAEKLGSVGFDTAIIPELATAIGVLRYTQARLTAALGEVQEAAGKWAGEEPAAYELRADLLAAMAYALRDVNDAAKSIKKIREGTSNADMLLDLKALAELGRKYQPQLEAINFDVKQLDVAAGKSDELGQLYAKAFIEKTTSGAKDIRDRAFTYTRKLMGDILDAAEYVFRKDKTRLDYYYSTYRSRRRAASAQAAPVDRKSVV